MDVNRRAIVKGALAASALPLIGDTAFDATPVSGSAIQPLDYADVTLHDGIARRQARQTLDALLSMDEAALLRPFRAAAGMPIGSRQFGGWYDASPEFDPPRDMRGFIPGHSMGQYLSAMARGYAVFGDAIAKAKVDRLVAGFAETITPNFYRGYPLPAYTFDKILIGLLDAYQFAGNQRALALVTKAADAVASYLPGHALDRQIDQHRHYPNVAFNWDETYTLPENLYIAAERGAGDRFHQMAQAYLLDSTYFAPLAAGRNVMPHRHAYSHMNALSSAMKAYLTDGTVRHLAAARNGFGFILDQSFVTGGWGPNEAFIEPGSGALGESLDRTHASFEAPCGTYGHFKVARYLMRATGDSRYGDSMERLFYNAALGLLPLKPNGEAFYYADYSGLGAKTYFDYTCPCCSGTIGQLTADYGISAYLRDARGLYVNLYTPSDAIWRGPRGQVLMLVQSGGYPLSPDIRMRVETKRPATMVLRLRIPAWAGLKTRLMVNQHVVADVRPGRFATITREWHSGDEIALDIDMPIRSEAVDAQHPDRIALMQGPLALVAAGFRFPPQRRADLMDLTRTSSANPIWMSGGPDPQTFRPWFAIGNEPTRLYQEAI